MPNSTSKLISYLHCVTTQSAALFSVFTQGFKNSAGSKERKYRNVLTLGSTAYHVMCERQREAKKLSVTNQIVFIYVHIYKTHNVCNDCLTISLFHYPIEMSPILFKISLKANINIVKYKY